MIIYGHDKELVAWANRQLGIECAQPAVAIGIADQDRIIASIVYNNLRYPDMQMTIATISPKWASKKVLRALFHYPFNQEGVKRVTAITEATNQRCRAFLCRIGFKQEGYHPDMFTSGDAVSYGMIRKDCRWLAEETGAREIVTFRTDSTDSGADCSRAGLC